MAESSIDESFSVSVDRNSCLDGYDSLSTRSIQRRPIDQDSGDEGDLEIPFIKTKKRVQRFADSDSDAGETTSQKGGKSPFSDKEVMLQSKWTLQNDSDSSSDTCTFKNHPQKSRIRNISNEEDSDTQLLPSSKKLKVALKNKEQQARMTNKRDKLRDKFKNLLNSSGKDDDKLNKDLESDDNSKSHYDGTDNQSENSEEEEGSSIEKLKQVSLVYNT